jgi:hypothetical protein
LTSALSPGERTVNVVLGDKNVDTPGKGKERVK